jgi:4-amino-4-deoxy-L-arabinose transferase-like glycosyltransferase
VLSEAKPPSPSRPVQERWIVLVIIAAYLAIGALYAVRVPPYNAPDEPAHFNYARDLAERMTFPVLQPGDWDADLLERLKSTRFPPGSDVSSIRYESHQPPLYYLAVAPVAAATRSLGERGQLVAVRLATVAIGAAALAALYAALGRLFICDPTARLAGLALIAFVPMHVAVSASVSNDVAAELWLTLVLWAGLGALRGQLDGRRAAGLGLLVGLGMLTKLLSYVGVPLAALAILAAPLDRRLKLRYLAIAGAVAAILVLPWLIRGALLYGVADPFGLRRHDLVVVGQPLTGPFSADLLRHWLTTLLHSFWGQFGWMGVLLDQRIYAGLGLVTAAIGLGVLLWLAPWGGFWRELDADQRRGFGLAAALILGVGLLTVGYNLSYLQPQGRYLFPAMAGIAAWAVGGLRELIAPRQRAALFGALCAGLAGLDLVALFRYVEPALRP